MVTGCGGQCGREMIKKLVAELGSKQVVATDLAPTKSKELVDCQYEQLDIRDQKKFNSIVKDYKVDQIIHMAAVISSVAERNEKGQ
jgi:nucleoside-diphosphate-sugar epimerase